MPIVDTNDLITSIAMFHPLGRGIEFNHAKNVIRDILSQYGTGFEGSFAEAYTELMKTLGAEVFDAQYDDGDTTLTIDIICRGSHVSNVLRLSVKYL